MKKTKIKNRNPFVQHIRFKKSGAHAPSKHKERRANKQENKKLVISLR